MNSKKYCKIQDNPDMVKDTSNGAILNTNIPSLNSFKSARKKEQLIFEHEKQIHMIQDDISEIKNLLQQLIKEDNS
jgi:hypothetical protein